MLYKFKTDNIQIFFDFFHNLPYYVFIGGLPLRRLLMDENFELPKIGDILVEEFLEPLGITPYRLAKDIGVSTSSILDLVHNKRKISVEMSLRLSKYFGTTSKFWLNMQNELDLREIQEKIGTDLDKIPSCKQIA